MAIAMSFDVVDAWKLENLASYWVFDIGFITMQSDCTTTCNLLVLVRY